MSTVARLMDNMRVRLPGALDGVIELELYNAIVEMCQRTHFYRKAISVTLVAGQKFYDVTNADYTVLVALQAAHPTFDPGNIVFEVEDEQISFVNAPTSAHVAQPLILEASVQPKEGAPVDPDAWLPPNLFSMAYPVLIEGVLHRMMMQLAKPYSNPKLAQYHGQRFRNLMSEYRNSAAYPEYKSWSFPKFA